MEEGEVCFGVEDGVAEGGLVVEELETVGVSSAKELKGHFHEFMTGEFGAWEVVEDGSAVA